MAGLVLGARRRALVAALAAVGMFFSLAPGVSDAATAPSITSIKITERTATGAHRLLIVGGGMAGVTKLRFGAAGSYRYSTVRAADHVEGALRTKLAPLAPAGFDLRRIAVVSPAGTSNVRGAPPKVNAVRVVGETEAGGLRLEVDGTNLRYAKAAWYGTAPVVVPLTSAMLQPAGSDTQISPIAPPGAALSRVVIANAAGGSNASAATAVPPTPPPPPTIKSAAWVMRDSDNSYEIILRGTGFLDAESVVYGDGAARMSYELQDIDRDPPGSDSEIHALARPGADLGHIRIVTPNGESNAVALSNMPPPVPVLTRANFTGYGTYNVSHLLLEGQHLATATSVTFGTGPGRRVVAVPANSSDYTLRVTAPVGADVTQILVSTGGGHSNIIGLPNVPFVREARLIQKLSTVRMWIFGQRLSQVTRASFGYENQYQITYNLQDYDYTDDGAVQVEPPNVSSLDHYHIVMLSPSGPSNLVSMGNNQPAPSISSVQPFVSGGGVPSVRIYGSGFKDVISVNVGGVNAPTWSIVSATEMTAQLPSGASGDAAVKVQNVGGVSNAATVRYPAVSSVAGATENGAPVATIYGSGLTGAHTVFFGFTPAPGPITVLSDGQIRVKVPDLPAGQSVLNVPIVVRTPVGDSKNDGAGCPGSANCYAYPPPLPEVASVEPYEHESGVPAIKVIGSNFKDVKSVTIGGTATQWWPIGELSLIAAVPAGSGTRDVRVTNSYGTSAVAPAATVTSPSVSTITETDEFKNNNRILEVNGAGLGSADAVFFGNKEAPGIDVVNGNKLRVQIPQLDSSMTTMNVPVVVRTPFGSSVRATCPLLATCYDHRRTFVALGDSFSSGEGAGSDGSAFQYTNMDGQRVNTWKKGGGLGGGYSVKDPVTDQDTWYNNCHQSKHAYARLIEQQIHSRGYRLKFQACSGAIMKDVVERRQYLDLPANQMTAVNGDTAMVTLGIGGNDLGFAPMLAYCVFKTDCQEAFQSGVYGRQYEDVFENNIRAMYPRLVNLYTKVRDSSGNAPTFVIGYPTIFSTGIDNSYCADDKQEWGCADGFTTIEKAYITERQLQFTDVMRAAARRAGVHFVDLTDAYDGHEFSAPYFGADPTSSWIKPFVLDHQVTDKDGTGKFAFHPTIGGQKADYESLVAEGVLQLKQNPAPDLAEAGPAPTDHWWTLDRVDTGEIGTCALTRGNCVPLASDPEFHHPIVSVGVDAAGKPNEVAWGTTVRREKATTCRDGLWHGDKGLMSGHYYSNGVHYVHCGPHKGHDH